MLKQLFAGLPKQKVLIYFLLLIIVVTITYSNHFRNSFHFDDSHTIENNLFIKDIKNIPLFFKDGTTFSTLPTNQSYRPVVSTSLTIDYWLGNGYNMFYFHLSTFILFLLQGVLMFFFIFKLFDISYKHSWNFYIAAIAVAWYLLHPANAETVNYIIARSDIQSTFCVILSFVLYFYSPFFKRTFLYLLPVGIGVLAKPPAAVFAPLFFFYILLFEQKISLFDIFKKEHFKKLIATIKATIPAFVFCGLMYLLVDHLTPKTWVSGGSSAFNYIITQPYVIVHYFTTFFLPVSLSADTDWVPLANIWNIQFFIGCLFILVLTIIAFRFSRDERLRPISFGIVWFFIALLPTSVIPLSEVLNDHRIFFPYVGLAISVSWAFGLITISFIKKMKVASNYSTAISAIVLILLSGYAYGTYQRNIVWHTEESLWHDVTIKSPTNGRGLMNYGLSKMKEGNYAEAEKYFTKALEVWPRYSFLQINMGILKSFTGDNANAEIFFKKGIEYGSNYPDPFYFYGRFLSSQSRHQEAIPLLVKALELSPAHIGARMLLMNEYNEMSDWDNLAKLAQSTLQITPGDPQALQFLDMSRNKKGKLEMAEEEAKKAPTPEKYLNLSLMYYQAGKYQECIDAATEALKLKPDFAEAYNNIGSTYNVLKQYDKAIIACKKALEINPNFELAKNNLLAAKNSKDQIENQEKLTKEKPSADNYLNLSLIYYNQQEYEKCIEACLNAVKLNPNYADAYSNMGAAYNQLKQWDKAIDACKKALKINPQHKLAKGNLDWAESQKSKK